MVILLTTDGCRVYLDAVDNAFGSEVDFSQLIKLYGNEVEREVRYSPAECTGTRNISGFRLVGLAFPP